MMRTTHNTGRDVRHNFYKKQLRRAKNPYARFTGLANTIGRCQSLDRAEKGRALETLTEAWMEFVKDI